MKILAIEHEPAGTPRDVTTALLKAEARKVWDLQASGIVREIYFQDDRHEAVLILECKSVEEAKAILSTFPLVEAGCIGFEVIPLTAYTGYSRLFANAGNAEREPGIE